MAIITFMSDESKKPLEDLKESLGLIFKAAKGAVEKLPTDKVEHVAKDAVKEVGKAFESIGAEADKMWKSATGTKPPEAKKEEPPAAPPAPEQPYDDAYAPEPPEKK